MFNVQLQNPTFSSESLKKLKRENTKVTLLTDAIHTFFTQNSWFRFDECHLTLLFTLWHFFLAFQPRMFPFSNHFGLNDFFCAHFIASLIYQLLFQAFFCLVFLHRKNKTQFVYPQRKWKQWAQLLLLSNDVSTKRKLFVRNKNKFKSSIPELICWTEAGGSFSAFTWSFTGNRRARLACL